MLRANGDGVPVGDGSEIRAGVAIIGDGHAGPVAAEVIGQQVPGLSVVVIEGATAPREVLGSSANGTERLHLSDGRIVVADWYIDTCHSASESASGGNSLNCGGFGDVAQAIGRDAGHAIVALHRGEHDPAWLLWSFHEATRRRLTDAERRAANQPLELRRYNVVKPNLIGAQQRTIAEFTDGKIHPVPCYIRDGKVLPVSGVFEHLLDAMKHHTVLADLLVELADRCAPTECIDGLESMLFDGWLIGKFDRRRPLPEWPDNTGGSATISTFTPTRQSIKK